MDIIVTLTREEADLIMELADNGSIELDLFDGIAEKVEAAWMEAYADIMPYDHFNE